MVIQAVKMVGLRVRLTSQLQNPSSSAVLLTRYLMSFLALDWWPFGVHSQVV